MINRSKSSHTAKHLFGTCKPLILRKRFVEICHENGSFMVCRPIRSIVNAPRNGIGCSLCSFTRSLLRVIIECERSTVDADYGIRLLRLRGIGEVARRGVGKGDVVGIAIVITGGTYQLAAPGEHVSRVSHVARVPVFVAVDGRQIR